MGTKIKVNKNCGIISTGANANNSIVQKEPSVIHWDDIEAELNRLLETTESPALKEFATHSKQAVKQRNYNRLLSAAKKVGQFGLEFLKEASYTVLAEIVARAIF